NNTLHYGHQVINCIEDQCHSATSFNQYLDIGQFTHKDLKFLILTPSRYKINTIEDEYIKILHIIIAYYGVRMGSSEFTSTISTPIHGDTDSLLMVFVALWAQRTIFEASLAIDWI
ncbi:hypothetical protein ACJX0J_030046, partial [Zea mays]